MSTTMPAKYPVVGVGVSATSYADVTQHCRSWIMQRARFCRYICVTSVHGIVTAFWNPEFRQILNAADIVTPDGMPVVWALRSLGVASQPRVYGPDLMLALCEQAAALGVGIFLYGAKEDTLAELTTELPRRFPGLHIVGVYSPPFRPLTDDEDRECVKKIRDSGAHIIFVGLSTPKQEFWMRDHRDAFPGAVMIGVGAAFDFHAKRVRQAPPWMQTAGLDGLFRLCAEPGRLWKRYLFVTPQFIPLWTLQKLGVLRYPGGSGGAYQPVKN